MRVSVEKYLLQRQAHSPWASFMRINPISALLINEETRAS